MANYKPDNYNSLSSYLIVDDAQKLVDLLKVVFAATERRRFNRGDSKIAHVEVKPDDTVLMISGGTADYPASKAMLHICVPDVFKTYGLPIENNCTEIERPGNKEGGPDTRGSFADYAGKYWAVSTQTGSK